MANNPEHKPRPAGLSAAVADVTADLERAFNDGGVPGLLVPAVAAVLGPLLPGTRVVSRGPWPLQRSLLWALLADEPRRTGAGRVHHEDDAPPVDRLLAIDPDAARDLVLHALARNSRVPIDDVRHGRIARHQWGALAEAAGMMGGLDVAVEPAGPGDVELSFDDEAVRWRLALAGAGAGPAEDDAFESMADVTLELSLEAGVLWVEILDGRTEPAVLRRAQLVGTRLVPSAQDADAVDAGEEAMRRIEERELENDEIVAAAMAEIEGTRDGDDALWEPPAPPEREPSDR